MLLHKLPRPSELPQLGQILEDLGNPPAPVWARAVGVSPRTARRYLDADQAPRAVRLALWLASPSGVDLAHCDARNLIDLERALRKAAQLDAARLRRELARVVALANFGSANDPTAEELPVRQVRAGHGGL